MKRWNDDGCDMLKAESILQLPERILCRMHQLCVWSIINENCDKNKRKWHQRTSKEFLSQGKRLMCFRFWLLNLCIRKVRSSLHSCLYREDYHFAKQNIFSPDVLGWECWVHNCFFPKIVELRIFRNLASKFKMWFERIHPQSLSMKFYVTEI